MIPDHGKMLLNHTNNPNHPHLQVKGRKKPDKVFHTGYPPYPYFHMKLTSAPVQTRHTKHGILPAGLVYIGTYIVVRQQSARRQPWGWRLNLFYMKPGGAAPW